jgi:hypothetical protein
MVGSDPVSSVPTVVREGGDRPPITQIRAERRRSTVEAVELSDSALADNEAAAAVLEVEKSPRVSIISICDQSEVVDEANSLMTYTSVARA